MKGDVISLFIYKLFANRPVNKAVDWFINNHRLRHEKQSLLKKIYKEQPGEHIFKEGVPYESYPAIKFYLVFSMPFLRLLQKINIKFNATYLSFCNLFFSILAGLFFILGMLPQGAICFCIAIIFDLVDGPWARLNNCYSEKNHFTDCICDRIGKLACFFGLWYNQFYLTGDSLLGVFCIATYYTVELYAQFFLKDRFTNLSYPRFSVWEISFIIFFIAPVLNLVKPLLLFSIFLLIILYIFITLQKKHIEVKRGDSYRSME